MRGYIPRFLGMVLMCTILPAFPLWGAGTSEGQQYPSRAISYVIPFAPGGQSDVTAQYQKPYLEEILGVNVLIRHQAGAGGALGWAALAAARPDGYMVMGNNIPHIIIQPLMRDDAGYQTEQLTPVYLFQTTPIGIAVHRDSPYDTLDDLIAAARTNPGGIVVSGSGTHSGHHLALLQLQHMTGTQFTYIPATGAAPSLTNFLGRHSDVLMANSDDLVAHRREMKVLAIGTSDRFAPLSDVPTFMEQGFDMTAGIDRGVAVPPDTPAEIVRTLEDAFHQVTTNPTFRAEMDAMGFETQTMRSAEFAAYIRRKSQEIETVLRELGEL